MSVARSRSSGYASCRKLSGSSDCLPLYTDGIVEATFTDGEPFGPERLREVFAAQGEAEPGGGCGRLMNTVSVREQETILLLWWRRRRDL